MAFLSFVDKTERPHWRCVTGGAQGDIRDIGQTEMTLNERH